ncbi:hypothetical protein ABZ907_31135 [Nonomuraea wenchangensis]
MTSAVGPGRPPGPVRHEARQVSHRWSRVRMRILALARACNVVPIRRLRGHFRPATGVLATRTG